VNHDLFLIPNAAGFLVVMAGLVPAIHAAPLQKLFSIGGSGAAWMPGTRPGMMADNNDQRREGPKGFSDTHE
jgi:hypothetical protein